MKKIKILYLLILSIFFSCEPNIDEFKSSKGEADFTKYIAVGNSLTAGFTNGALYKSGQEVSYPNLLAEQLKKVEGGEFAQPIINSELGILFPDADLANGNPGSTRVRRKLDGFDATGSPIITEYSLDFASYLSWTERYEGEINNFGVPGAKVTHLLYDGFGNPVNLAIEAANPYYIRFAPTPTTSVLVAAVATQATFFTLWIGNNDILGYALAGGKEQTKDTITPVNGVAGFGFKASYEAIINSLTANGAKGVVVTIPSITSCPFFTAIPYPIPGELALLTAKDSIMFYLGQGKPVPGKFILDASEISKINTATENFNEIIKNIAEDKGLALVDANAKMIEAKEKGLSYDGIKFTTSFITGNIFSLDGIHLTARGNALMTNFFIEAINETYNANIPKVDITQYNGVILP